MLSLANKLTQLTEQAFSALGLPPENARVTVSGQAENAQFQCNGAMPSAKAAKKNPRQVAEDVIAKLQELDKGSVFSSLSVGGPGFINMAVKPSYVEAYLRDLLQDGRQGVPALSQGEPVMLDYGGPNIAKPMHVGHLRSSIIGDALRRMMLATGYKAIGDVHLGDWGTPMGMIIGQIKDEEPNQDYFKENFSGPYPRVPPFNSAFLEIVYKRASQACKESPERMEQARTITADLQNGHPGYKALWQHFVTISVDGWMKKNFDALGVHFDLWKGEGSVHELIAPMVESLKSQGLAREDDGALVIDVALEGDKKEYPPLILYKRDGAVMYGTTDLATLVDRMQENKPCKIIYVVDQRQGLHFEQVFRAARKSGIVPESVELTHAGFGTMNGPDGKPFKTRAGGVMKLEDLIAMGVEKARERLKEAKLADDMPPEEKEDIAHKVAIAAIKFADLQNNRVADYVFDLDRMTAFEGKTGPYLLYQAVRINSLLKKAEEQGFRPGETFVLPETDVALSLILSELPDQIALALKNYTPHVLCDYAFKLAQAFSSFYGSCHILSEENAELRDSRLALCALTARHLHVILSLLGISVPARM